MPRWTWMALGLLALVFALHGSLFAAYGLGLVHLPRVQVVLERMPFQRGFLGFIGIAEVLGALGLILPVALNLQPRLTTLAAVGLTVIMIGAFGTHVAMGEVAQAVPSLVLGCLCGFVAYTLMGRRASVGRLP